MSSVLAIIPARGGSKRIPRKNLISFNGKPIVSLPIVSCLQSGVFSEVMISTDDPEIRDVSLSFGAKVPFLRSEESSGDSASTAAVVSEVIEKYSQLGRNFEYVCCVYATSVFADSAMLQKAFELLKNERLDSVISLTRFSFPIQRALKVSNGQVKFAQPEYITTRSQDLEVHYHDAAQFYFLNVKSFLREKQLFMSNTRGIEIAPEFVQDIDNLSDLRIAEMKYSLKTQSCFLRNNSASS